MSVTIKNVAEKAGVSIATVSKVINKKPYISENTRKHVYQIMEELDYHPNIQASNFAKKCSGNIVFLAVTENHAAFHNPHMFEIMSGAQSKIREKKYNFSFIGSQDKEIACNEAMNLIRTKAADGMIIHGSATSHPIVSLLEDTNFPHIFIGRPSFSNSACWIDINNHVSGELAAKYLLRCGYSKIAFIGGPMSDEISRHRLKGFKATMEIYKHSVSENAIKYGTYSKASGFRMMEELLIGDTPPEAVICENNEIAMGATSAIAKHDLTIPHDIGLITFDDYPLSQLITPPLTVVDIDVYDMGCQAASLLLKKIRKPEFNIQSFSALPSLIIRASTQARLS